VAAGQADTTGSSKGPACLSALDHLAYPEAPAPNGTKLMQHFHAIDELARQQELEGFKIRKGAPVRAAAGKSGRFIVSRFITKLLWRWCCCGAQDAAI
jgi:hypothetical protein